MPEKNPTCSVIIPTYNRAHLVDRAIQSVLNQTYQNFEFIVVDDGSTDNTEEVVKKFQEKDKRIRYIKHERNKGASAARNTGIKAAKGEYIAFQDSDDEWLPEKLEKQMKVFETAPPEVGVIYTGFWRIENNKKIYIPYSWVAQKEGNIHKELLKGSFIGLPTVLIRKECFKKAGMFDKKLPRLQDWELFIRISKHCKFKYINEALLISPYTIGSISFNNESLIQALELILKKHSEEFKKYKKILSVQMYWLGSILCKSGKMKEGKKYFLRVINISPLNIKAWIGLTASLLGKNAYIQTQNMLKVIKNGFSSKI